MRAWQLTEDGIVAPPTSIEVRDSDGNVVSMSSLTASLAEGAEGEVALPEGLRGMVLLTARSTIEGEAIGVSYGVSLETEDAFASVQPGREVSPFHVYELGPLRTMNRRRAPTELDPRIEEGACVPELACWLSVWVGQKKARVRVRAIAGVRIEQAEAGPRSGFLRFPIVVMGHEARIEVEALGPDGEVVAAREVRLPVVPGGTSVRAYVRGRRVRLSWESLGARQPVLVDAYRGNRWTYALSVTPEQPWLPVQLDKGVWRLQVREDLFSANTAGVVHVVIADNAAEAAQLAARAVLADASRDGLDPLADAIIDGRVSAEHAKDAVLALFGPRNFGVLSLSGVVSRFELEPERTRRILTQWTAAALIVFIGLLVSLFLFRMELRTQSRAREILEGVGGPLDPLPDGAPVERWLWAFVLLIFVLIAVLALSKGWF
ncbi:MAG: hypothetical protein AAF500_21060 [Myxococcota bacterium]